MWTRRKFLEDAFLQGPLATGALSWMLGSGVADVLRPPDRGATDDASGLLLDAARRGAVLLGPGEYGVHRDVRLECPVVAAPGAVLRPAQSVRLELCGPIWAGFYPIFSGPGTVIVPSNCGGVEVCPQWWGATGDGETDDTDALEAALASGKVFVPPGQYRITRELVAKNNLWVRGLGNANSPKRTRDSWIVYDGPEDPDRAVLRVSAEPVGREPSAARSNVRVERLVLDANGKAGFGLYAAYCTNESEFANVTVRGATQHGFWAAKLWYATIRGVVAAENLGCGISIGRKPEDWSPRSQVNAVPVYDLRAHRNGKDGRFDQRRNPEWGYGIGFYPGSGVVLRNAVSERNDGAGIVYALGGGAANGIEGFYVENNGLSAKADGRAERNWGLIVVGHSNARANTIRTGAFGGSVGTDDAQSIWLCGDRPTAPLNIADVAFGQYLKAEWDRYRFEHHVYFGLRGYVEGRQPRSDDDGSER